MYIYAHIYFLSASCVSEFRLATSYDSELHVNLLYTVVDDRKVDHLRDTYKE